MIRPARSSDAAALEILATLQREQSAAQARIVDPVSYVTYLLTAQAEAGAGLFVATDAHSLVGQVLVGQPLTIESSSGACAFLSDLYIHPAHRRSGLGRALTEAAETYARAAGASRIALKVLAGNFDAVDFYRELGYEDEFLVMSRPLAV